MSSKDATSNIPKPIFLGVGMTLDDCQIEIKDKLDFDHALRFLKEYESSKETHSTYRKEIERFQLWKWMIKKTSIHDLKRADIHDYIKFFRNPPKHWRSKQRCQRFHTKNGQLQQNDQWRPFIESANGQSASNASIKIMIGVLSSYFSYLVSEQYIQSNPIQSLRRKTSLIQKKQEVFIHRQLSTNQWQVVIATVRDKCLREPRFERHLFAISCFFLLGLRISELGAHDLYSPQMNQFYQDHHGCWWYRTLGKGNKLRDIAVADELLDALSRFRLHLGLSHLPMNSDTSPLIPKVKGSGSLGIRQLRSIVKEAFMLGVERLTMTKQADDATILAQATTHWLRHTAITNDIMNDRPIVDVRDDAGHGSIQTTNVYLGSRRADRHKSARAKRLLPGGKSDDTPF